MSSAFFAQIITSLSSRLRFSGGIRFDNLSYRYERDRVLSSEYEAEHQQDHTAISPKVGLNYEAVKNLSVYASVAGAFKAPTLAHMYESPPIYFEMPEFAGYFQISNADLEPQEGVCYETGLKYQNTVGTSADVAIYYYDIKNEIDFDPVQQKYLNIGESIHSGVELTLSQRIVEELYLSGQIDYISSEFEGGDFDGNQINGIPKYNYSLALDYRSEKLYRLRMEARGRGQQYIDQANSEELADYLIFNFTGSLNLQLFTLTARVNNIFNKKYIYDGYVGLIGESRYYPAQGTSMTMTLSKSF
jgi:outer membrane receptor protein involved in Fe transport